MPSEETPIAEMFSECLKSRNGDVSSFLGDVFEFLATRTNFYQVSASEELGYPPGAAEKLVIETFRRCDPYKYRRENIFLPATVAEEVEISSCEDQDIVAFSVEMSENVENEDGVAETASEAISINNSTVDNLTENIKIGSLTIDNNVTVEECFEVDVPKDTLLRDRNIKTGERTSTLKNKPPDETKIENSESFNGATRDTYSWSQNICELDVTVILPEGITSKQLKVNITADSINVSFTKDNKRTHLIEDKLTQKIKPAETLWVMSEGRVRIHLEKQIERWWDSLVVGEPKLDTSTLNCSRPLHELPEEHLAKVQEVRWNHMQRLAGLPTSDDIQRENILKKAWNLPGSPFANQPFDPNMLNS